MFNKIYNYLLNNNIIIENKKIIVGYSGGPDSTLLIHFLLYAREKYKTDFFVMHLNHKEREEADFEEEYVANFCKDNSIPVMLFSENIYNHKDVKKMGFEMLARNLRKGFFLSELKKRNADYIFTGHNADDKIETMFLNMERGSGIKGLTAMRIKNGNFVKPLLFLKKNEIIDYLRNNKIEYIFDETNNNEIFGRNRIRHNIMPVIKKNLRNGYDGILRTLNNIEEYNYFIDFVLEKLFENIIIFKNENQLHLDMNQLLIYNKIIKKIILIHYISDLYMINSYIIEEIIKMLDSTKPSMVKCFKEFYVIKKYNILIITDSIEKNENSTIKLELNKWIKFGNYEFILTIENKFEDFNNDEFIYLSFDAGENLFIRSRKNGDRIIPFGMENKKKIKNFFIDYKIPRFQRDEYPLIVNEKDEILWIAFMRRTNKYKILNQKEFYKIYGKKC